MAVRPWLRCRSLAFPCEMPGLPIDPAQLMTSRHASHFPRWTLRNEGVIAPDERLPLGATLALGVQHVVAMFGATVLAPLLLGFDPNVALGVRFVAGSAAGQGRSAQR